MMRQTAQTKTDRPASGETPWCGSVYRMPSRMRSPDILKPMAAVLNGNLITGCQDAISDKAFMNPWDMMRIRLLKPDVAWGDLRLDKMIAIRYINLHEDGHVHDGCRSESSGSQEPRETNSRED